MKISVIICTYNPRDSYMAQTLDGLKQQSLDQADWELLVIDNRSDVPVAGRFDLSWHAHARILREEELGLTPARLTGISESTGEILVFVDDDNVLDPDYLEQALRIAHERPFLGAWGGQCRGIFEQVPPEWTKRYWGLLALHEFDEDAWSNQPRLTDTLPVGAGLCIRRAAADHYLALHQRGDRKFALDRKGDSLISCGDHDLAACACDLGLGTGKIAALKLQHQMPAVRFTQDYLARLCYGTYYSGVMLDAERGIHQMPRSLIGRMADFIRLLRIRGPHRAMLKACWAGRNDAAAALKQRSS
jgi:glycosyltransferase involved in cell wall biosynthesis